MNKFIALLALVLAIAPAAAQNGLPGGPGAQIPNSAGGGGGGVTGVTGTAPIVSSGGAAPAISVTAASKTDEQGGISGNVTTPSQQQQHDSAAKAWIDFTGSTGATLSSYNASVASHPSAGVFNIAFAVPFATANYACQVTPEITGATTDGLFAFVGTAVPKTVSTMQVRFLNLALSGGSDPAIGHIVCFGRQ